MFVISGTLFIIFSMYSFLAFRSAAIEFVFLSVVVSVISLILGIIMYAIEINKYMNKKHPKKESLSTWGTWKEIEQRDKSKQ